MTLFRSCLTTGLLASLLANAQTGKQNGFAMAGCIRGLKNDSVIVFGTHYDKNGKRLAADTLITTAANDRFVLKGAVPKPQFVWLQAGGFKSHRTSSLFLENGNITVDGNVDSMDALSFTGTPSNNDMTASRRFTNNVYERIKTEREVLKKYKEEDDEYKKAMERITAKFDSIQDYELRFIKTHPASQMSSVYLYVKQDKLPVDELEALYNSLSSEVRANDMVAMIPQKIAARRSVAPGNTAPDFASTDTSGRPVKLSDFRGKYVLLEFRASWCVPCRQQSPQLVALYKKYADKGFTILQYSLDDKNAAAQWKEAIRKDGLLWTQVSDLNGFDSRVAKRYGVQPIPDNFLIDPAGKILARGITGETLHSQLSDRFK